MSSRNVKSTVTKVIKETEVKSSEAEAVETKTALLSPSSLLDHDLSKNGSHAPSSATIAVEEDNSGTTPDDNIRTRRLDQIKQRVSQEFAHNTLCRMWCKWLIHLAGATLPYVAILIGAIYRDECPANRNIPVHLIVAGVALALLHLSTSIDLYRGLSYLKDREKPAIFTLVSIFLTIWMILGCVWTFGIFLPEYDYGTVFHGRWNSYGMGYCNYTLYWFAFVFNIISLVAFVLSWLLCCCWKGLLCNMSIVTCLCVKHKESPVQV